MIKYLVLSKTEPKPPTDIQYTVTPPPKKKSTSRSRFLCDFCI